uniref:ORF55 n=1 Tax=Lymantria dispar multicapsid nuclear polyhedrosis virus TaxID=10449 RepID=A0A2S1XB99_NPVLD|nr:ORF55 [Lymantria dispar multiple nucleopolyhedrovirus]
MDKLGDYLNGLSGKKLALAAHFDESRAHSSRSLDFLHYVRRLSRYDASEKNLKRFIDMSNEYYFKLIEHAHALVEILVNVSYSRKSTRAARRLTSFVNMCAAHALGPMLARLEGGTRASAVAGAVRDEDEEDDEPAISYAKRLNRSLYFLLNKKLLQLGEFVFYKYTQDNDRPSNGARDNDRGASGAPTTRALKIFDVDVEVVQIAINLYY